MVQAHVTEPSSLKTMANPVPDLPAISSNEIAYQQVDVAKTLLLQAIDLIDNHLTSDDQLTMNSRYMPGSTMGQLTGSNWS